MDGPAPLQRAGLPRWLQVSEALIREILAGRLPDGARLPPEREMAASHGISVGTLRKALAELEGKGLLRRIQGSGNYVRHKGEVASVYSLFRLEGPGGGGLPTAEILEVRRLSKPAALPPFGTSPEAHRIRRLRRLDGVAVAVEEIWLDAGAVPRLTVAELGESLYRAWRERFGLIIGRVEDRVGIGAAPDWAPAGFAPAPGSVVGRVDRRGWAAGAPAVEGPVEVSRTWFDPDRAAYVSRMGKG
ncbi:GntR family transcriptional regulator [Wenxinia saemankumensis]|uniref:Transcriptional regulator, GntR family n=1 Tax=Wenxinia saemankumensis TaxID=1447782 RepID=A0A1M6A9B1_9RHOB|nr:GntR family transcriptional regulator [Wenxinia saemankumensis]SHI33048.1 transcriptional regulator, GntR family [Wenxinia saemankumensis]